MGRGGGQSTINRLIVSFGNECHYCGEPCNRRHDSAKQATKDHIVPKFFGGANHMENYLLACRSCNNDRQNQLFYCDCMLCSPKIMAALKSQSNIDYVFAGLMRASRYRIRKVRKRWMVVSGPFTKTFATFDQAVNYACYGMTYEEASNGV